MEHASWLLLAIVAAFGCAMAVPLVGFRCQEKPARFVSWCAVPGILACPLLIPREGVALRAAAAFVSIDLAFKVVDFFRYRSNARHSVTLREYYWLLIPFPVLSIVYPDHKRRLPQPDNPRPHVARLFIGTLGFLTGFLLLQAFAGNALLRSEFLLDHIVKLPIFVLAIESLSCALYGLERLAGFDTKPIVAGVFRSRTVAEFWQRYNYRVHDWHYRNVFRAAGGRRRPARAMALVFLFSGLYHELMFGIATSRFDGSQLAFFLVQAPAALASGRIERWVRKGGIARRIAAHGFTILFLSVTSILFFRGVSRVFPFIYASGTRFS
jgi:hypothetical protein